MKNIIIIISTLLLLGNTSVFAEEDGHGHEESTAQHAESGHGGEHEEEGAPIELSPAQVKQAGIQTQMLTYQPMKQSITAPGTVSFNGYNLSEVTTVVDGVVAHRFVRLGDNVKRGQRLVSLNSSALAQAQADYLRTEGIYRTAKLDIERLQGLVEDKIVSESRFQQAQSNFQAAKANLAATKAALSAYGMRNQDIEVLMQVKNYGLLTLRAPSAGTVTSDNFHLGQRIEAGTQLMRIVDESTVWVEVKLPQSQIKGVHLAGQAMVINKENQESYPAKVINIYHQLDNATRTVGVRLKVDNPQDVLHPGMFVTAEIESGIKGTKYLFLPEQAVQRQGSELIVFIEEETGHFERREVEVGKTSMGLIPITKGIAVGEIVVVKGAFVLASELAKSGFAVHNH